MLEEVLARYTPAQKYEISEFFPSSRNEDSEVQTNFRKQKREHTEKLGEV